MDNIQAMLQFTHFVAFSLKHVERNIAVVDEDVSAEKSRVFLAKFCTDPIFSFFTGFFSQTLYLFNIFISEKSRVFWQNFVLIPYFPFLLDFLAKLYI